MTKTETKVIQRTLKLAIATLESMESSTNNTKLIELLNTLSLSLNDENTNQVFALSRLLQLITNGIG